MRRLTLTLAALIAASPATAAVLTSAPASAQFSGDWLFCHVQNVSASPRAVVLTMLDFNGNDLTGGYATTLPAGGSQTIAANPDPVGAASCRVTVAGSGRSVRASALYRDPDTGRIDVAIPLE